MANESFSSIEGESNSSLTDEQLYIMYDEEIIGRGFTGDHEDPNTVDQGAVERVARKTQLDVQKVEERIRIYKILLSREEVPEWADDIEIM